MKAHILKSGILCLILLVHVSSFAAAPVGWACWAGGGKVYRAKLDGKEEALTANVGASHATWSYDGTLIFYITGGGDIYAMNNDGTNSRKIGKGNGSGYSKIAAYRPEPKSVLYANGSSFYKINAANGETAKKVTDADRTIDGEIAISVDGTRLVFRKGSLFKMTKGGKPSEYAGNCSASLSPDGKYMTENQSGHTELKIFNWSGGSHNVKAGVIGKFDNQSFAVNSNDWICAMDDDSGSGINDNKGKGIGIVNRTPNESHYVVATSDNVMYPRFFVGELPKPGGQTYVALRVNKAYGLNARAAAKMYSLQGKLLGNIESFRYCKTDLHGIAVISQHAKAGKLLQ